MASAQKIQKLELRSATKSDASSKHALAPIVSSGKSLLDIPIVVVNEHLLECLSPADIFRLRHVHPITRSWVMGYDNNVATTSKAISASFSSSSHVLEISSTGSNSIGSLRSLGQLNPLDFCTRISIKNDSWNFFKDAVFMKAFSTLAPNITHLFIKKHWVCFDPAEKTFYDGFVKLTHLEIDDLNTTLLEESFFLTRPRDHSLPSTFKKVKHLKIGQITYARCLRDHLNQRYYIRREFLPWFSSLECIKCPAENYYNSLDAFLRSNSECFVVPFMRLLPYNLDNEYCNSRLSTLDIQFIGNPPMTQRTVEFILFAVTAAKYRVALENVHATYFQASSRMYYEFLNRLRNMPGMARDIPISLVATLPVHSIINVASLIFRIPMPNLKKITVTTCHTCYHELFEGFANSVDAHKCQWPRLEELDLNINSVTMGLKLWETECVNEMNDTMVFLRYVFGTPDSRPKVKVVRLSFLELTEMTDWFDGDSFSVDIASACRNLTKLELCGWKGDGKSVLPFWRILKRLREVIFVKCENLGDDAFVGEAGTRGKNKIPTFLKLKDLKSLVLKRLDKMPGITDVTFKHVVKFLPLVNFEITSDKPLTWVTTSGIESLLTGCFAKSIVMFPFDGWSLENVSDVQFLRLSQKFRSAQLKVLCDPLHHYGDNRRATRSGLVNCQHCATLSWSLRTLPSLDETSQFGNSVDVAAQNGIAQQNRAGSVNVGDEEEPANLDEERRDDAFREENLWESMRDVFDNARTLCLTAMRTTGGVIQ